MYTLSAQNHIFEACKMPNLSRRSLFKLAGLGDRRRAPVCWRRAKSSAQTRHAAHACRHAGGHLMGAVGRVTPEIFNPTAFLRSWNFSDLPAERRAKFYRETPQPDGTLLREYELFAVDREIEIAPGIFFPGLDLQRPGARSDAARHRRGSRPRDLRQPGIASRTRSTSTAGIRPRWTARCRSTRCMPGGRFVYEFDAEPFGCTCITATRCR